MIDRMLRMKAALVALRVIVLLGLLLGAVPGVAMPGTAEAQGNGGMVIGVAIACPDPMICGPEFSVQVSVADEDGTFLGACTVEGNLLDGSHTPACAVSFASPPTGMVIVTQDDSGLPAGYAPVENPIRFDPTNSGMASHDVVFQNEQIAGSVGAAQGGQVDIAIVATENGASATDVCFVLVDFSNEGCDRNGDGQVTFDDVPVGTYTVRQTADLGAGRSVADFTIQVTGNVGSGGRELFPATVTGSGGGVPVAAPTPASAPAPVAQPSSGAWPQPVGAVDISLITRDLTNANLLTGACYVLVGYSNEGCDENGDGQVTFDAIPYGTYTVQQTRTPTGYPTINEYDIEVAPLNGVPGRGPLEVPLGFLVRQAPLQNAPNTRNVSVILIDAATGQKVVADICTELVGGSIVGCDGRIRDGQIDFLDVPAGGPYELSFSEVPAGWRVGDGITPYTVVVDPQPGSPSIIFAFVLVDTGGGGAPSTGGAATTDTGAIAVVGGDQLGTTADGTSLPDTASTGVAVQLILDTSGSMDERDQGNRTRMEVAREVTTRLVTETLPAGVPMGLRTFNGCSSSLRIPMEPLDPDAAATTIAGLRADGSTPIGQSLRAAGNDLDGVAGPKIIVLVTDGEETCNGDPLAEIEALVARDIDVQVNIVGFAIDDAALTATFQEWARVGNGTYFQASDPIELNQAVTEASQLGFRVIDPQGTVVADGTVGGDAVSLPVGTWTVEVDTVPAARYEGVVVAAGQTTTIDLNASAVSDLEEDAQVIVPVAPQEGAQVATNVAASPPSAGEETWTASFSAYQCNLPPNSGPTQVCTAEGGIVMNISLASGERLGSCSLGDPQPLPLGGSISTCRVEGMPFNENFVATQDASTIPDGYLPHEPALNLSVDDLIPGGGDQTTFTFFNVQTDAGSTGSEVTTDFGGTTTGDAGSPTEGDLADLLPIVDMVPTGVSSVTDGTRTRDEVVAALGGTTEIAASLEEWGWSANAHRTFTWDPALVLAGGVEVVVASLHGFADAPSAAEAMTVFVDVLIEASFEETTVPVVGSGSRLLTLTDDTGITQVVLLVQEGPVLYRLSAFAEGSTPSGLVIGLATTMLARNAAGPGAGITGTGGDQAEIAPVVATGSVIEWFPIGCGEWEACLNATVTVSTADGQLVSSCTFPDTLEVAPWFCPAQDVPRGITVTLTIDGLVPGYEAVQNPIFWDSTNEPNQYSDVGMPGFDIVPTGGDTSSGATGSGEATLLMTFRACPEGFDPGVGDFFAECTIPLDAPDAAFVYWGVKIDNDPGGAYVTGLERQYDGAYVFQAGPGRMDLNLSHLQPVLRDGYRVIGADDEAGIDNLIYLVDGETREIFVFYYYE